MIYMIWNSAGNVGIGTTNPLAKLHVQGTSPVLRIGDTQNLESGNGGTLGQLIFGAHVDTGVDTAIYAYDVTPYYPDIRFKTTTFDRMTIQAGGNVGIGTTAPGAKLEVAGNVLVNGAGALEVSTARLQVNGSGNDPIFTIKNTGAAANDKIWDTHISSTALMSLDYRAVGDAYGSAASYMTVTRNSGAVTIKDVSFPNGNVGIGTTSPLALLDVNGALKATTFNGNTITAGTGTLTLANSLITSGAYSLTLTTTNTTDVTLPTTGTLATLAGTESFSGKTFTGDTFFPLGIWNAGGNIGIGTTTPSVGTRLAVMGGNVGIGTTGPTGKLQVDTTNVAGADGTAPLVLNRTYGDVGDYQDIVFGGGNGNAANRADIIRSIANAGGETALAFLTQTGAGDAATHESMRILGNGNVGIGTTAPTKLLNLYGTQTSGYNTPEQVLRLDGTTNSNGSIANGFGVGIDFRASRGSSDNQGRTGWISSYLVGGAQTTEDLWGLKFGVRDNDTERDALTILNTGYVGIGTTSPQSKLDVTGDIYLSGGSRYVYAPNGYLNLRATTGTDHEILIQSQNASYWSGIRTSDSAYDMQLTAGGAGYNYNQLVLKTGGNVGIGVAAPAYKLDVSGAAGLSTGTLWTNTSDARVKQDITTIPNALDVISQLHPAEYNYTPSYLSAHPEIQNVLHYGFIAQEYQQVFPNSVTTGADGYLAVNQTNLIPYAIKAIQEQSRQIGMLDENISSAQLEINNLIASQASASGILAGLKVDSNGALQTSTTKADKLLISDPGYIVGSEINGSLVYETTNNPSTPLRAGEQLATNSLDVLATLKTIDSKLADQESRITNQESRILGLQEQIASTSASLIAAVASLSAVIAGKTPDVQSLDTKTSGVSPEATSSVTLASPESTPSTTLRTSDSGVVSGQLPDPPQNDSSSSASVQTSSEVSPGSSEVSLNLTPPEILLATTSAQLVDLSVSSEATFSGKLTAYEATIQNSFKSLGDTSLGNTLIAGSFNIDGTMSVTGNSINSLSCHPTPSSVIPGGDPESSASGSLVKPGMTGNCGILNIQNGPLATLVNFFNGLVTIDNKGNLIAQTITAKTVNTEKLIITTGQENPAPTIGSSTIPTGQTEIPVFTSAVTDNSKIFITATSPTGGQALVVSGKITGTGFVVSLNKVLDKDVSFDWWIVDTN